jgi:hypothetical protein
MMLKSFERRSKRRQLDTMFTSVWPGRRKPEEPLEKVEKTSFTRETWLNRREGLQGRDAPKGKRPKGLLDLLFSKAF